MNPKTDDFRLEPVPADSTAIAQRTNNPNPSTADMLAAVIAGGITEASVRALESLCKLREHEEDRDAERAFSAAFVAMQSTMPAIVATKGVPDKNGNVMYSYAPYESIMEQVRPLLLANGFAVSFSSAVADGRVVVSCTLQHTGGAKRINSFGARIGRGPPNSSDAQGDGAASTYAKRFALCDALNIVVDRDTDGRDDARAEGAPITWDQADYLREQVRETKSDEASFLRFAGAAKFEEIGSAKYEMLVAALAKKARRA